MSESDNRVKVALGLGLGVLAVGVFSCAAATRDGINVTEERMTVCDKESVRKEDGNEYRVYVADENGTNHTRRVSDMLWIGGTRFNSADFYAGLDEGVTYDMTTSGFRFGFASMFPNILTAEELPAAEQVNFCE